MSENWFEKRGLGNLLRSTLKFRDTIGALFPNGTPVWFLLKGEVEVGSVEGLTLDDEADLIIQIWPTSTRGQVVMPYKEVHKISDSQLQRAFGKHKTLEERREAARKRNNSAL